jgi:hypothetical protein
MIDLKMIAGSFSKRERRIAYLTLALASAAVIYCLIIDPLIRMGSSVGHDLGPKKIALEKDLKMLSNYRILESEHRRLCLNTGSGKAQDEEMADLLMHIEDLSRTDSCFLTGIKPIGVKVSGDHKEMLVDISAEGDLSNLSKFFYDIENSGKVFLRIRHFTINSKAGGQTGNLKGNLIVGKLLFD